MKGQYWYLCRTGREDRLQVGGEKGKGIYHVKEECWVGLRGCGGRGRRWWVEGGWIRRKVGEEIRVK